MSGLEAFIGEWTPAGTIPDAPQGRVLFEWMPGQKFLIERCDIPHLLQHGFDSRGVARVLCSRSGG